MNNENNPQQAIQLDISPETARGVYSNLALIAHSHSDFILDFAHALPGMPKPAVGARVIMAPEHAKRLLHALADNIAKYERAFGEIQLAPAPPDAIAPFHIKGGEA